VLTTPDAMLTDRIPTAGDPRHRQIEWLKSLRRSVLLLRASAHCYGQETDFFELYQSMTPVLGVLEKQLAALLLQRELAEDVER
jgi:hypothetical protein